jgi:hypothetical protein
MIKPFKFHYRGRLREMFPMTSFAGGLVLSDSGVDLLSKLLEVDPAKVSFELLVMSEDRLLIYFLSFFAAVLC